MSCQLCCVWLIKVILTCFALPGFQDFSIEFQFSHNEWFTNEVLTLSYQVKCEVDDADPWTFEGATIYACKGCVPPSGVTNCYNHGILKVVPTNFYFKGS